MIKSRKRIEQTKGCCPNFRRLRAVDEVLASAFWTRMSLEFGLRVNGPNVLRVSRTSPLWAATRFPATKRSNPIGTRDTRPWPGHWRLASSRRWLPAGRPRSTSWLILETPLELRRRVEDHCCDHRAAGDAARVKAPQRAGRPRSAFARWFLRPVLLR